MERTFSAVVAGEWTTAMDAWYGLSVKRIAFAALGTAAALGPAIAMGGFTVDDALISVRYAHHVALGVGHRFLVEGPPTDGVTPLFWPYLLAPFAKGDAMATLDAARALGVALWSATGAALGIRAFELGGPRKALLALGLVALAFPLGAWAVAGMETPLATALATFAVLARDRPRLAALLAGLAASLRPEMAPWSVAIAIGAAATCVGEHPQDRPAPPSTPPSTPRAGGEGARARVGAMLGAMGIAAAPLAIVCAIRLVVFGHAAPLAVLAKPSDLGSGATYAFAASVVVLLPICAPLRSLPTIAFTVHALAIVLVGGDWMPYARLMIPVTPALALAIAEAPFHRVIGTVRVAVTLALGAYLAVKAAPAGRHVYADRAALVAAARPVLASAHAVAALDIGWTSAAYDGPIVDLAGLTDPSIAVLPGGHTSKHVDATMLLDRHVDALIVFGAPRVVEARLLQSRLFRAHYEPAESLPLSYRVFRATASSP